MPRRQDPSRRTFARMLVMAAPGLVFLADPTARGDTGYALATEVDGGYRLVRNDDQRILRLAGRLLVARQQAQGQRVRER